MNGATEALLVVNAQSHTQARGTDDAEVLDARSSARLWVACIGARGSRPAAPSFSLPPPPHPVLPPLNPGTHLHLQEIVRAERERGRHMRPMEICGRTLRPIVGIGGTGTQLQYQLRFYRTNARWNTLARACIYAHI